MAALCAAAEATTTMGAATGGIGLAAGRELTNGPGENKTHRRFWRTESGSTFSTHRLAFPAACR